MVKMVSPNGKCEIDCHPGSVENQKRKGWKEKTDLPGKSEPKTTGKKPARGK